MFQIYWYIRQFSDDILEFTLKYSAIYLVLRSVISLIRPTLLLRTIFVVQAKRPYFFLQTYVVNTPTSVMRPSRSEKTNGNPNLYNLF